MMLKFRSLNAEQDWWFFDPRTPISDDVRALVHPLEDESAGNLWSTVVSNHLKEVKSRQLPPDHWICNLQLIGPDWSVPWNDPSEPDTVTPFLTTKLPWKPEQAIFFVLSRKYMLKTTWHIFLTSWKHFLFDEDGPFIISLQHPEFIYFANQGLVAIGERPVREQEQNVTFFDY
jgi:hypothetical protein